MNSRLSKLTVRALYEDSLVLLLGQHLLSPRGVKTPVGADLDNERSHGLLPVLQITQFIPQGLLLLFQFLDLSTQGVDIPDDALSLLVLHDVPLSSLFLSVAMTLASPLLWFQPITPKNFLPQTSRSRGGPLQRSQHVEPSVQIWPRP